MEVSCLNGESNLNVSAMEDQIAVFVVVGGGVFFCMHH